MEATLPFLFAAAVGFGHAFEADHLVAVSNLVTKRDKVFLAIKDGIYWGLGHSSTIIIIGFFIIIGKVAFQDYIFGYFEAIVGFMLIILGIFRLVQITVRKKSNEVGKDGVKAHHLAYGVGLIHGLAGSGAMVLLVMSEIQSNVASMIYLVIFGIGSIAGMLVAAGIFSLPFTKRFTEHKNIQFILILLSSLLCIGYGLYVIYENIMT